MKIQKTICDRCKKEYTTAGLTITLINIFGEKEPDPSGHGYIDNAKDIDLCNTCISVIINVAFEKKAVSLITNSLI